MMEVTEAIKKTNKQKDKTPGPDGLPAEFYKSFQDIISLPIKEVCNEVLLEAKILYSRHG